MWRFFIIVKGGIQLWGIFHPAHLKICGFRKKLFLFADSTKSLHDQNFSVFQAASKEGIDHLENCQKYLERVQLNRKEFYTLQGLPMPVDLNPLEVDQSLSSPRRISMTHPNSQKNFTFITYLSAGWTALNEHVFPPIFRWTSEKAIPYVGKVINRLRPHVHTAAEVAQERLAHEFSVLPDRIEQADQLQKKTRRVSFVIFSYLYEKIFLPSIRWTTRNIGPYWTKIVDYIAPGLHTASDKVRKSARKEWHELSRRLHESSAIQTETEEVPLSAGLTGEDSFTSEKETFLPSSPTLSEASSLVTPDIIDDIDYRVEGIAIPLPPDGIADWSIPHSPTSQSTLDFELPAAMTPIADSLNKYGIFASSSESQRSPSEVQSSPLCPESK